MKTCHQCGERLISRQEYTPVDPNDKFVMAYTCKNGHTGRVKGQPAMDRAEWTHTGEVWGPTVRADAPDPA